MSEKKAKTREAEREKAVTSREPKPRAQRIAEQRQGLTRARAVTKVAILLLAIVFVAGCTGTPDVTNAADTFLGLTGEEYRAYVSNDGSLSQTEKDIRISYLESFERVVNAAKGGE